MSYIGSITHVCISLINYISSFLVHHNNQSAIQLAHVLVKAIGSQTDPMFWAVSYTDFFLDLMH